MSSLNKSLVQPHSIEAEFSVIGGLLLDNELFDEVSSKINEGDFYNFTHRLLFKHISELIEAGKPADILTLDQYLTQKKVIEDLGGFAYLAEIVKNTPSTANIHAYTDIVLLYSKQRQLLKLGQFIVDQTQSAKTPDKFEAVVDDIEKKITEFSLSDNTKSAADLSDIFANMLSRMELSAKNGDPVTGTPTGIQGIDEATTGGQPGDLIVIGARPSMGKTAFSQTIAYHTLKKFESAPVFYHSMEMPADQILQRFLAMRARVGLQNIRQADSLDDEEWSKLTSAMGYILEHWKNRLVIDDEGSLTPQKLRTKVRQNARKYGNKEEKMIKPITVNEALIGNALLNIKEGNIHPCLKMGFSEEQLKAINNLSIDEIMDISNSVVSFAKVEINHETFWKLLAIAQANTQQRQIIDRALLLGASIEMLHQYFGLSTSEVSARRQLLGIEEKMGRKAAASDEESTHIWEIWQRYKQRMEILDSQEGLELLCLIAEEGNMNLTVVWKLVSEWYSKHK